MSDKYDKLGNPLELEEWCKLMEDRKYCRVAYIETKKRIFSTVWLGLDHNFGEGKPLIFESMAFSYEKGDKKTAQSIYQDRYSSLEGAYIGHYKMIIAVLWQDLTAWAKRWLKL